MANIKKNGNLSGAIGNIVFVNDGIRAFIRTKPDRIKQSPQTKAAAGVFGLISTREKLFRLQIFRTLGIPAIQYFAARHRARIQKTVTAEKGSSSPVNAVFGNPKAMEGFSFNPKMDWDSCTNFFPAFEVGNNGEIKIHLPELRWKKEIKPPKDSNSALLTLVTLSADLNVSAVHVNVHSKVEMEITAASAVPKQEWVVPVNAKDGWLLIIGCVQFISSNPHAGIRDQFSATYLWAGQHGE